MGVSTRSACSLMTTSPQATALPRPNGGNCATRGSDTPTTRPLKASCSAKPPPPPARRVPGEPASLAAAPVGGGGVWPGLETRRIVLSTPGPTGVEGAGGTGGPGCGARGRWRGQAAVLVGGGRARAGLEIDHSERSSRVAISRAGRRRPAHTAARPIKASHATVENQPGPPIPGTPVAPQAT